MHYYQFNIGDYQSHTAHLDESEDLAYRRMLDWCYLHEKPLPEDVGEVARLIRMRSHSESIANVLREFFELIDGGWWSDRVGREIQAIQSKSEKAKASAQARWSANAMRTHSEGNAIQDPRPKTQDPKPNKTKAVVTATPEGVSNDVWESFLAVRKAKKSPVTTVALVGIEKEAQKAGMTLEQALAMCCTRGWQGFKASWAKDQVTASEARQTQMAALTRGLATPKPAPANFWAKPEQTVEVSDVERKRLL
jgi:uncharacterized protein YdaU (DUF1376 family)